jgi:hypothetical protein
MFAAGVSQKAEALARTIVLRPDPDVIEGAEAELVQLEAAAADLAGDFVEGVEVGAVVGGDTEDPHPPGIEWADQGNRSWCGYLHIPNSTMRGLQDAKYGAKEYGGFSAE